MTNGTAHSWHVHSPILEEEAMRPHRRGFTLIELLVVIAIIGVLMGLILPAVQSARKTARKTECASNMKNVALALFQFNINKGRYPNSGTYAVSFDDPAKPTKIQYYTGGTTGGNTNGKWYSWVVDILPYLDQNAIFDSWDFNSSYDSGGGAAGSNSELANTYIKILTCPEDDSLAPGQGNLSFAVNGGFCYSNIPASVAYPIATPPAFDPLLAPKYNVKFNNPAHSTAVGSPFYYQTERALGVMFPGTVSPNPSSGSVSGGTLPSASLAWNAIAHTGSSVIDGQSTTLMIGENLRTGVNPGTLGTNWANPDPNYAAFYGAPQICMGSGGSGTIGDCTEVDYNKTNSKATTPAANPPIDAAINSGQSKPEGASPFLSSFHPGGVNVGMCDGSVRFIQSGIDGNVLAKLISSQGGRSFGRPAIGSSYSGFAQSPLNEDY